VIPAVGFEFTVIVAEAPVKPELRVVLLASVTDTSVYVVLAVTGFVKTLNGVPLITLVAVRFAVPSLYTTVYGPIPEVAVHVSRPVPVAQNGPLAVRLP
jgi:hypothetical protein